ncbi:MAG: hypothetical protein N3D09_00860 [Archaeoglobaceae archaeon]|nr:hypothetical protein [Archaeoglobaceae archaeon]
MRIILSLLHIICFCFCIGYPQLVNIETLDKVRVLNITEDFNNSSLKFIFNVENNIGDLVVDKNESDFGIYANGIKIGEPSYYDGELKKGLSRIEAIIVLNRSNLKEFWRTHVEREQSELKSKVFFVYKLDGSFLRIFETRSWNVTTNLLPEVNASLCNLTINLFSEWGKRDENETEIVHRINFIGNLEEKVLVNSSIYLNGVMISAYEEGVDLNSELDEISISQKIQNEIISELLKLKNIFTFKFKIKSANCFEVFEQSKSFDLVVK